MKKGISILIILVLTSYVLSFAQDRTVKGVVKDKGGSPIPGVSVKVKNSSTGASTGTKGEYAIT
ncbi:MAG: carboxypeptidase-like regulatory domain-containing protein, partial [Pedobacter sp.]|nr:carboxypeptidase-like regulatory domain-containing protein [Pedobacter sp.]